MRGVWSEAHILQNRLERDKGEREKGKGCAVAPDTVCDHCKLTGKTKRRFTPTTFGYNSGLYRMGGTRRVLGAFRCISGGSLAVAVMSDAVSLWRCRNEKAEPGTRLLE